MVGMRPSSYKTSSDPRDAVRRIGWFFVAVSAIIGVFWVRAFYLQVIKHEHYVQAAKRDQMKEYQIPAPRGVIRAHNGDDVVPIVLNQKLYTVYADPTLVKDADKAAHAISRTLGGDEAEYKKKLTTKETRYVVLAKKVEDAKRKEILSHKFPGIGAQEISYRTYPNGTLASQLLGFVNDEGAGVYGIEQALNEQLSGKDGELKAVTDASGVPLAANNDNIRIAPVNGSDLVLTIDVAMQKQLEVILQRGVEHAKSERGGAVIMDPNTGAIKAMANWPTFDPNKYNEVEDPAVFTNDTVSVPLEIGSTMKPITAAAAIDAGVIRGDTTYYDPAVWEMDDAKITNVEGGRTPGQRSIAELLDLSINTGATWLLMQMSKPGGNEINKKGREMWHDYMVNRFRFGKETGIEQGYEGEGIVPDPNKGAARNLVYANTTFGQAMTATPLQMAAAFSAMLNGGTYYQPRLVDEVTTPDGKKSVVEPKVLASGVVKPSTSDAMRPLLEYVVENHSIGSRFDQSMYSVGGKTGTAQVAGPDGKYKTDDYNGTYVGFVGGDKVEYVISIVVYEPKLRGYAGSVAAQPIFADLADMLIANFGVTPRSR